MTNPTTAEMVEFLRGFADRAYLMDSSEMRIREAADIIEQLQQELADERYRHDRLQDFCVAQGEDLSKIRAEYNALLEGEDDYYDDRNEQRELTDEQRKLVDYIQKKALALAKAELINFHEPRTMSGEPIQFVKYGPLPKMSRLKEQQKWVPVTERQPEESCAAWVFDRGSRGEHSVHLAFFVEKTGWMPPITSEKDAYWLHISEPEPPKE